MINITDIIELHSRQYSLYNSQEEQEEALQELRERNYMIFDKKGTEALKDDFLKEFSKTAHEISFLYTREQAKTQTLFRSKKHQVLASLVMALSHRQNGRRTSVPLNSM